MTHLVCVATACGEDHLDIVDNLREQDIMNVCDARRGPVEKYHGFWQDFGHRCDVIFYLHSDLIIHEDNWQSRVLAEFEDPTVAIVGFGGATAIGLPDLYKVPYCIENLIRRNYASNQTDWQTHGAHETGSRDVAVVDGFAMCVRTEFLRQIGGWSQVKTNFHCYDLWLCLLAHRHGWKVRTVGIRCTHKGGGTSTSPQYAEWCNAHGTTMEREHSEPHVRMYREFTDILPLQVGA